MRQIYHEAGIAPGRAFGNATRFDNDDLCVRCQLMQPTRRGKPGKPASNNDDISRQVAVTCRIWLGRRQNGVPGSRAGIMGKAIDYH